ncbi:ABC transporter substrate-binding protein [Castellaniella sp.]|uniref:ABC transporter substrate-binding protein n=1 Tax=Castellaniella sp. TaxID=1955812 RepID=UPI00355FFE02
MSYQIKIVSAAVATALLALGGTAQADEKPVKVGIVTFMSGAAAGPFGVPARHGAEVLLEELNAGKVPAPYDSVGFGGTPLEFVYIDESGGTSQQVTEFRNMVDRAGVDMVIGYTSSGNCLAIAPVAEELKTLTMFYDCGTPRIFEDDEHHYVFRPVAHGTMDNVGAAMYAVDQKPDMKTYAGINQNYAWGQDSWRDFEGALKQLKPDVKLTTSQMPKLGAGQYNAEISAIMASNPDILHSSFYGGDLEGLIVQAQPRGMMEHVPTILTTGETITHDNKIKIPDGTIIGARGPHGVFAPDSELNTWFRNAYQDQIKGDPWYPSYKMAQTILGTKAAYEKAKADNGGQAPNTEQIIAAFEGLTFVAPSGEVKMALGNGHQAVQEVVYGTARNVDGKLTFENVKRYPSEVVTPPEGVKSEDWIKNGMKH